ncbi:MAG: MarR family winged helix-turn-helix transcriptional regulator [Pseudomonadota bacterium]
MDTIHLLHRAGQVADMVTARHLAAVYLTPRQYMCLLAVENGAVCQRDVVERTGVDRSTVADMCRRLERDRMLTRTRGQLDSRRQELELTEEGKRTLKAAKAAMERAEDTIFAGAGSKQEADALLRSLNSIAQEFGPISSAIVSTPRRE